MHQSTKIPPALRKEIYKRWKTEKISQRQIAKEYHVDKRIIGRIIDRGKKGDFSVHTSVNKRFLKPSRKTSNAVRTKRSTAKKKVNKK